MISIDEPLQPSFRVALQEDIRIVRGKPAIAQGSGKAPVSWIDLSPVTAISLAAKMTDDAELANFIAAEKGQFRYDYVRLRCSFFPCEWLLGSSAGIRRMAIAPWEPTPTKSILCVSRINLSLC